MVAVVGDVMGRGVEAAASMAQIRSTLRAYAVDDPEPVSVFRRVDAFFAALDVAQLVTVLYFLVDPVRDEVLVANAGHLPPLLLTPGGCDPVEIEGGVPFGVGTDERHCSPVVVPHGAAILAITDGLVERRGEDIDDGIARIIDAACEVAGGSARQILAHVVGSA